MQTGAYSDVIRALGEIRVSGDKGHKGLVSTVLPRLALYEVVPATLAAQLLQIVGSTEDRTVLRSIYYFLQLLLGIGSAGTPSPVAGTARASS